MESNPETQPKLSPQQQKKYNDVLSKIRELDKSINTMKSDVIAQEMQMALIFNRPNDESEKRANLSTQMQNSINSILSLENKMEKQNLERKKLNESLTQLTEKITPATSEPTQPKMNK